MSNRVLADYTADRYSVTVGLSDITQDKLTLDDGCRCIVQSHADYVRDLTGGSCVDICPYLPRFTQSAISPGDSEPTPYPLTDSDWEYHGGVSGTGWAVETGTGEMP